MLSLFTLEKRPWGRFLTGPTIHSIYEIVYQVALVDLSPLWEIENWISRIFRRWMSAVKVLSCRRKASNSISLVFNIDLASKTSNIFSKQKCFDDYCSNSKHGKPRKRYFTIFLFSNRTLTAFELYSLDFNLFVYSSNVSPNISNVWLPLVHCRCGLRNGAESVGRVAEQSGPVDWSDFEARHDSLTDVEHGRKIKIRKRQQQRRRCPHSLIGVILSAEVSTSRFGGRRAWLIYRKI